MRKKKKIGVVLLLGYFTASNIEYFQGITKSQDYQGILEQIILPNARKLSIGCRLWVKKAFGYSLMAIQRHIQTDL